MSKCPQCGVDVDAGMKFCGECGAAIPQTKECPKCHLQCSAAMKFCGGCGYNFSGTGGTGGGGIMGDKNVIAGDVTNTVTNNTTNTYINEDETKKLVRCAVCERPIVITEARTCKECHQYVCATHYDSDAGMCITCIAKKTSDAEAVYRRELEVILEDGRIDRDEFDQLEMLRKQLGLSAPRAMELQKMMKVELAAKRSVSKGEAPLMLVEKAQCNRAKDLLFDFGKGEDVVRLLESIYQQHPLNEEVLSTYLAAMCTYDEDRAKAIITSLPIDMVRAYLVLFDIELRKGDLAAAEVQLNAAEKLWPDNMLLKCRHAELLYATAIQLDNQNLDNRTYLAEAMDWLTSLESPKDKLESSWQFYVQVLISQALGDEVPTITQAYCKEKNLYFALVSGQITGVPVIDEKELCKRCLRNRDFASGTFASISKSEFRILSNAATRGDVNAELIMGDCYFSVDGCGVVLANPDDAFSWYKKAADRGLAAAQFMLGVCYEIGVGCGEDSAEALKWYTKAAELDDANAIEKLKAVE